MTDDESILREGATGSPVWFIGDSVTATGYRLAGARVLSPPLAETYAALQQAIAEEARIVLLCAAYAAALDVRERAALLAGQTSLLLVVPDARGGAAGYDVPAQVRSALGSEF